MSGLVLPPTVKSIGLSTFDNRKPQSLLAAAQHNRRHPDGRGWQRKSDPKEIHRNECLMGPDTCEDVVALHAEMMATVGYTPKRHDYTQSVELLFTTPHDFAIDHRDYLVWCLGWAQENLGHGAVLSADTHFDEGIDGKAPHLHILMAPIVNGEWAGSGFVTTKTWPKLQAQFGRDIELKFGLKLMPQLKGKALTEAATAVKERLTELLEGHIDPAVLAALLKLAGRKPSGLMGPLGITGGAGGDGGAAFRRIALSTGKGAKKERTSNSYGIGGGGVAAQSNSYGIETDPANHPEKPIPFLCSGIAAEAPPFESMPGRAVSRAKHPAPTQPLSNTPDAHGEIAPPPRATPPAAHPLGRLQEGTHSGCDPEDHRNINRIPNLIKPNDSTQQQARQSPKPADHQIAHEDVMSRGLNLGGISNAMNPNDSADYESDETHRERDDEHEAGRWCSELGGFIQGLHGAGKRPQRAARASLEDLVAYGVVTRGRAGAAGRNRALPRPTSP